MFLVRCFFATRVYRSRNFLDIDFISKQIEFELIENLF